MSPSADEALSNAPLKGNPPDAPWIIQKFGGTSLGKFAEGIAEEIVKLATILSPSHFSPF
jgi:aspartate kinase